jgi:nitrogen fixation/metabolism regulation signal transduction histidine kinase
LASPSPVSRGRHRRFLKNYLLDKSLQLRYVSVVTVLSAAVSGILGYCVWYQANFASRRIRDSLGGPDMEWLGAELKQQILQALRSSDKDLVYVMVAVGLGLICVLSLYLIVMTHQVAGPLYKIGLYFDALRDGALPKVRELRKGDQLQDVYARFKDMTDALRRRTEEDVAAYANFVRACEAASVSSQAALGPRLDELRALIKEREEALRAG